MNKLVAIATLTLLSVSLYSFNQNTVDYKAKFEQWQVKFNKHYSSSERSYRQTIYEQNLRMIDAHNADPTQTYTMGENQFADLSQEEFVEKYLTLKQKEENPFEELFVPPKGENDGKLSVDWSDLTKVKNQGECGGCWAFSAVGAIEGFLRAVYTLQYPDLSEQQLIDCDDASNGCNGGWPYAGILWASKNYLLPDTKYPYAGVKQTCAYNSGEYAPKGYKKVDPYSLDIALNKQPVSVCVDATNWNFYKSGILDTCGKTINHGVLAVGWRKDYWIVKNSWGTQWGEDGFIRLSRQDSDDLCAITQQAIIAY